MGKKLIIIGADFATNALERGDGPTYRAGQILSPLWVTSGTKFTNASGYAIVVFPVTPGETYSVETDRTSSAFAFSSVLPANNVVYIGGERILATPESPQSGTVPSGAAYMGVVYTYENGANNIFPSAISLGDDIVRVSDYR